MRAAINRGETIAAMTVVAVGVGAVFYALQYDLGSLRRLGPGAAPLAEGLCLLALGVAILLENFRSEAPQGGLPLRPVLAVGAGAICWALTVDKFGFVPATCLLVLLSSLAEGEFRPIRTLVLCAILTFVAVAMFIWLLGIPLDLVRM